MIGTIIGALLPLVLTAVEFFLRKSIDDKAMQELFFDFVERIQGEYLKSAKLRENAKARMQKLAEKPFVEAP